MRAIIERLELRNYRSCQRTTVDFDPALSVLIGPNGSGKTNLLHGLLLLRKLARLERQPRRRESASSPCSLKVVFRVGGKHRVALRVKLSYATDERNNDDVVGATQEWDLEDVTGARGWVPLPLGPFAWGRSSEFYGYPLFEQPRGLMWHRIAVLEIPNLPTKSRNAAMKVIGAIAGCVKGISYYSASQFTDPSRCPIYLEIEDGRLSRRTAVRGREHIEFLNDLYSASKAPNPQFTEYQAIIGKDGVGLVDRIDFQETEAPSSVYDVRIGGRLTQKEVKRLLVIPSFHIGRSQLSPNQLSEGTFKTLALIFYLMTDRSKLLLIEEPEVCVHHGLLDSVVNLIRNVAGEKQIVVSTHSDFVLDAMDPKNVFVVRNDSGRGTVVRHVSSVMSKQAYSGLRDYLKNTGNLGEYWRHGGLEQ